MRKLTWISILLALCFSTLLGCSHVDTVSSPTGIFVTQGDGNLEDYASIAHIYAERNGFYLFGIPIIEADLGWGIDQMVKEAKQKGANGVIELEYEIDPPSIIDWFPYVRVKGNAVTFKQ